MVQKSLSVIIPVYNEYENLNNIYEVYSRLLKSKIEFQVIIVESGSSDNSKKYLDRFKSYQNILILHEKKRNGWGSAVKFALHKVTKKFFVLFPIDNQYSINEIIVYFIKNNISIVTYRNFLDISVYRTFQSTIFKNICKILFKLDFLDINSLKIIEYKKLFYKKKYIKNLSNDWSIDLEFLILMKKKKINFIEKELNVKNREKGQSKVSKIDIFKMVIKLFYLKFFSKI
jgi:hypothetical protein